jgi:hypothetical protein
LSRSKALERSSMPRQPILVVRAFISINGEKSPCRHSGDLTGQQPSDKSAT